MRMLPYVKVCLAKQWSSLWVQRFTIFKMKSFVVETSRNRQSFWRDGPKVSKPMNHTSRSAAISWTKLEFLLSNTVVWCLSSVGLEWKRWFLLSWPLSTDQHEENHIPILCRKLVNGLLFLNKITRDLAIGDYLTDYKVHECNNWTAKYTISHHSQDEL